MVDPKDEDLTEDLVEDIEIDTAGYEGEPEFDCPQAVDGLQDTED